MQDDRGLVIATTVDETRHTHERVVAERLLGVLPSGATVVICGSMNHFIETPERKIARELSRRQFDVVLLPYIPPSDDGVRASMETEMMRCLICRT